MTIQTTVLRIQSEKENSIVDLTRRVSEVVSNSKISDGIVTIFVKGSTASVTTIENEPGLLRDFPDMLSRIAPKNIKYYHEEMWHDGNGHSHVKASLIGPSLTVPFNDKVLCLGTWQQIVFVEMDTRSRNREIILQIMGE